MNLHIDHIRKSYEDREILADCSFAFTGSGVFVLRGANGCGKSTLLRICSLLELPDSGEIRFLDDGSPLPVTTALRRRLTLVLPRTGVFNTSVFHNVAYGLRIRGIGKSGIEAKVKNALSFVGLEQKARQHARTLSSGETQRMGLARALAIDPEILLLDEPTASVDDENTGIIESIIRELNKNGRTMIIMTTHDRDQAERLADRLLTIRNGKLEENGKG